MKTKLTGVRFLNFFVPVSFFLVCAVCAPLSAGAQYGSRESGWGSSSYRSKVNALDDDPVDKLPVPILFGIPLRSITPNFGDSRDGGDRTHEGLDIMAPKGAPIVSPTEAVVIRTGSGSSSGKYVTTANPGGESFVYMHLSEILVKNGDELDEGELIGYVGNTGNASGGLPHLHFEVRDGRRATDPFPRITQEFSLKEKIHFLEDALQKLSGDDEEDFIKFVTETYTQELRMAEATNIDLPNSIEKALSTVSISIPLPGTGGSGLGSGTTAPGDLALNSSGPLVVALQGFLIAQKTGPAAQTLASAGATGFFGPITERALIEYQNKHGIVPAVGYFGPKTRAYILANQVI